MCSDAQQRRVPMQEALPVFQGSLLNGAHPVAPVLLAQPADKADELPMVLAEEQLRLLHVTPHCGRLWGSGWPSAGPSCHSRLPWPFPGASPGTGGSWMSG